MPVKQIIQDSFEQLAELGQSTVRSSAKQVVQTLNPFDMIKNSFAGGENPNGSAEWKKTEEQMKKQPNSTPVNFGSLEKKYASQDEEKINATKNRLFQMVRSGEKKQFQMGKQKGLEKQRQENGEENRKERRAYEEQQKRSITAEPQGKIRHFIFRGKRGKKTTSNPQLAEIKPSTGHQ